MLANNQKTITMSAVSALPTEDGMADVIMYMSANINQTGEVSFGQSIKNIDLYRDNIDMVNADYAEFQESVLKSV